MAVRILIYSFCNIGLSNVCIFELFRPLVFYNFLSFFSSFECLVCLTHSPYNVFFCVNNTDFMINFCIFFKNNNTNESFTQQKIVLQHEWMPSELLNVLLQMHSPYPYRSKCCTKIELTLRTTLILL